MTCSRVRATHLAVALIGSHRLDATPGLLPAEPANDTQAQEIPELKWVNVANEGQYLGHSQGEFALTPQVMQQMVTNLRASPKYEVGEVTLDGKTQQAGIRNVVQYDYEHASEMAPWEGTIPVTGAPAIGWVRDLELRQDANGRTQMWALSWLSPQIREQIKNQQYDSVSIAWNPNGKHWVTGEPIGAVLTSVAFTNHPFLQDLESLAAREIRLSRSASAAPAAHPSAAGQRPAGSVQRRARTAEAPSGGSTSPFERATMPPEIAALLARLCSIHGLQPSSANDVIIRAAENASAGNGKLNAVLQALGFDGDVDAALKAIPGLMSALSQLDEMKAQIQSMMQADAVADEAQVTPDVGAAMSSRGLVNAEGMVDAIMFDSFKALRANAITAAIALVPPRRDATGKEIGPAPIAEVRAARERGRQAFLAQCGVQTDPRTSHLSRTFVSGPGAAGNHTQYPVPVTASALVPVGVQPLPGAPGAPDPARQPLQLRHPGQPVPTSSIDWNAYQGANWTQRIIGYLASVDPQGFGKLEWGAKVNAASAWRASNAHLLPAEAA